MGWLDIVIVAVVAVLAVLCVIYVKRHGTCSGDCDKCHKNCKK